MQRYTEIQSRLFVYTVHPHALAHARTHTHIQTHIDSENAILLHIQVSGCALIRSDKVKDVSMNERLTNVHVHTLLYIHALSLSPHIPIQANKIDTCCNGNMLLNIAATRCSHTSHDSLPEVHFPP